MAQLREQNGHRGLMACALVACFAMPMGGCATLPSSGPTGSQITKASSGQDGYLPFSVIEVSSASTLPQEPKISQQFLTEAAPPPTNLIGVGDVLSISIYEAGVKLFGGEGGAPSIATATALPTANVERLPQLRVDSTGNIRIPFGGVVRAAGRTTAELETLIRGALRGMSQNPQILVAIIDEVTNSVIVGGEVGKPGRLVLSTNQETLSDATALAGGYKGDAKDLAVRVERAGASVDLRLSDVLASSDMDFRIVPGDRITVTRKPRSFAVMGAAGKTDQIAFPSASVSLAEAIAQAGGSNPNTGDPKAIFVFRFVKDENGDEVPVVYHLNMMQAGTYFLAQKFAMRDKDILYIGNAEANQPSKFISILSQLFTPILLTRQLTQ